MKKFILLLLACVLIIVCTGCTSCSTATGDAVEIDVVELDSDVFSNRDYRVTYELEDCITIELDQSLSVTSDEQSVSIEGSEITITKEGTYYVTGTLTDGRIVVETTKDEKVQLILAGVEIANTCTAGIYVRQSDKVFITIDENTTNTINTTIDESACDPDETSIDAGIYSADDLTLNGLGTLNINTVYGSGIKSKDDLKLTCGTYNITVTKHGLVANDTLAIDDSTITVLTNGGYTYAPVIEPDADTNFNRPGIRSVEYSTMSQSLASQSYSSFTTSKGIKCDDLIYIKGGTISLNTYDDAISSDTNLLIDGGDITIYAGDDAITSEYSNTITGGSINIGYCYEGIEGQKVTITGGEIDIFCYDDGINASTSENYDQEQTYIHITGGNIVMEIKEDNEGDGLDSNGDILMTGGSVLISGTTNTKDTPLDYDGDGQITGGTFVSTGSSGITKQNFGAASTQCSMMVEISSVQTGVVKLADSQGNILLEFTPAKQYQVVTISMPELQVGETYTLTTGTKTTSVKFSDYIYGVGTSH